MQSAQILPVTGDYKDLVVYQKAKENVFVLFKYYKNQKLLWSERFVVLQLLRAAGSIGANIVEGYGRLTRPDYRHFIGIARASALEVEYWLDILLGIRSQDKPVLDVVRSRNIEVIKILTTFVRKLKS